MLTAGCQCGRDAAATAAHGTCDAQTSPGQTKARATKETTPIDVDEGFSLISLAFELAWL
jgi:hypothetical protein